jgi:hypothetical protein
MIIQKTETNRIAVCDLPHDICRRLMTSIKSVQTAHCTAYTCVALRAASAFDFREK